MPTYDRDKALLRTIEVVGDLRSISKREGLQRRHQVVDMYGIPFEFQGDQNSPGTVGISISKDLVYIERFEFKITIKQFMIPIAGGGTNATTLKINGSTANANAASPHNHGVGTLVVSPESHNHTVSAGITAFPSNVDGFEVWIEGVNMTPYFKAQYGGNWITGEGVFPANDLSNYDVIEATGNMSKSDRDKIMSSGYKRVEIRANGAFRGTIENYLKYSHANK